MKTTICSVLALAALLFASLIWAQDDKTESKTSDKATQDEVKRVDSATTVLTEIMDSKDKGIPEKVMESAKCVAVVPSMLKAGFVVGGRYGKGIATCRTTRGWSAPAPFTIAGGDWGLQIGGEAIDLVMLVMNEKGLQDLLSSKFEVSGEAGAAAGPVGRHAAAGTDWKLETELLTYSRSKGAFAGATIDGAVVKADNDSTEAVYGKEHTFRSILSGEVATPASAEKFRAAVIHAEHQAQAKEASEGGTD